MLGAEVTGLLGGALTTIGWFPQVIRVFRLRSAHEISLPFTLLFLLGGICWLIYGVSFSLLPVILWNGISIAIVSLLLYAKLKYGR